MKKKNPHHLLQVPYLLTEKGSFANLENNKRFYNTIRYIIITSELIKNYYVDIVRCSEMLDIVYVNN